MKRKFNRLAVFFILQILSGTYWHCQAQENIIEILINKFEDYVEAVPWEEIYIHTDREEYIAGEYVWTNIYLIERQSLKPSTRSRIAYVELLNSENRPVIQKRFLLQNGFGPGQVQLPDTLSTGIYTLRAYTNWMKNFLPYNCFIKDINIYNALKTHKYEKKSSSDSSPTEENIVPEESTDKGIRILFSRDHEKGGLEINIKTNNNYTLINGDQFYLFIQTHGKIDRVSSERIIDNNTNIYVPEDILTPGINQITVFNSKGQPVCESYNYTPNRKSEVISIAPAESYGTREKIILEPDIENVPPETLSSAIFSVSVMPRYGTVSTLAFYDYLIFGTEYGLYKTDYSKLSDLSTEQTDTILQNIRSSWIKWDKVLSDQIPDFKFQPEKEEHFLTGKLSNDELTITPSSETVLLCVPGRQPEFQYTKTDKNGDFIFRINIDEDIKDLVIMPDNVSKAKKIILESSYSDKYLKRIRQDNITIKSFPDYIEDWSINFQTRKIYGIAEAGNSLQSKASPLRPVRFYGNPDFELILADYVSLPKMEEVFFELLPRISLKHRNSVYEILIADRINENRYELSPDLFLDGVKINDAAIIAELDPQDVEKIDVVKEKYAIGNYFFQGILNVVTISADFTSIPLPEYMIRLPYRVIEPVLSFMMPDYSSEDNKNSSVPDFRNTLYWNPCLKPDEEGKIKLEFWTSDITGDYEINLQGISSGGSLLSERKFFRIE